jgi:hypothetical protein
MTQLAVAARSQIRNVVLCTLAALTLAACGSESGSSSAAATSSASDTTASLVSPNAGAIDRSRSSDTTNTAAAVPITAAASSPASTSGSTATTKSTAPAVASTVPAQTTTTGVATLDWMPPTQNSAGSILTNLAGYTVYYGTSPSNLTQSVKVTNPGLAAYTVTNLTSGIWYFAITSISADGVESTRTGTVSATI